MEVGQEELKRKNKFYLNLDRAIEDLYRLKRKREKAFYSQSFTRNVFDDVIGLVSSNFNLEKEVTNHVDATMLCDRRIKRIRLKKRYVNDYLHALDPVKRQDLMHKYKADINRITVTSLDQQLHDEILEIEEAINFMLGIDPDFTTDHIQIEAEQVENNFQAISQMLGV